MIQLLYMGLSFILMLIFIGLCYRDFNKFSFISGCMFVIMSFMFTFYFIYHSFTFIGIIQQNALN